MYLKCLLYIFILSVIEAELSYYTRPTSQPCYLPRLPHGRVRLRQKAKFIKFTCFNRYTLIGDRFASCINGRWDVPTPVCARSGCPPLEPVKNAVNITMHNDSWKVFFCLPGHQLVGSPVLFCDGRQWNSTAPECVDIPTLPPTECDFEKPDICGWRLDELHDFDWRRWNMKTPSSYLQTGPAYDHTYGMNGTGHYMYIESTGRIENDTSRLISPVYDKELARDGCFVFYYHMYGRSMGGLRVYQKPEKESLYEVLVRNRENYTLFEQWGDQGNEWYTSVSMLYNFSDSFQIVIEGIRGESFMSDLAIDDVSIQHGENCTRAMDAATTPASVFEESCVRRCDEDVHIASGRVMRGCSCNVLCFATENCCPDFLDVCVFQSNDSRLDESSTPSSNDSVALPQTQRLVATATETLPPPTSTSTSTSSSTTTSTSTTTPRPTTTTSSTTTTTTATKRPTTRSRSTTTKRTTFTTTTKAPTTTTTRLTTPKVTRPTSTTPRPTTRAKPISTSKSSTLTVAVSPISSTTIFFVRTTKLDDVIKKKDQKSEKENQKVVAKKQGMSGVLMGVTVMVVLGACCGAGWAALVLRSSRGVAALARLRARRTSSAGSEVRYLKSDVDDDDDA